MEERVATTEPRSGERSRTRSRRRSVRVAVVGLVVVLGLGMIVLVGLPVPGRLGRPSARALTELADHINDVCGTPFGAATVRWLDGRVDRPSGAPMDLTPEQVEMLGNGPKVGCVSGTIH